MTERNEVRIGVIGLNHNHIYHQVDTLLSAGAVLTTFYAPEDELAEPFAHRYPQARRVATRSEVLEDEAIQIVAGAAIPNERAPLGIEVMRHGKDYFTDKPGFTTLQQLAEVRAVHEETGRFYFIAFGRLGSRAIQRASELVAEGAIGRVVQVMGLGPHRIRIPQRPSWFFERARYGGIITDLGSHQADQFLHLTGSDSGEVTHARVANLNHPQYPELEDFGEAVFRSPNGAAGYLRVDWFTPDGLRNPVGDQRLFVLGTDGHIEVRTADPAGRPPGHHLLIVDNHDERYVSCADVALPFGPRFLDDVRDRTQSAISQEHCFQASALTLRAEESAGRELDG